MKVRIDRTRMAMSGCHYAYDGLVACTEVPNHDRSYFIVKDGVHYLTFPDATRPVAISQMDLGIERYKATLAHEASANTILLTLAKQLYPELAPATNWPELWVSIPDLNTRHATKYIDFHDNEAYLIKVGLMLPHVEIGVLFPPHCVECGSTGHEISLSVDITDPICCEVVIEGEQSK